MNKCYVVAGETAVGKSSFAIKLAKKLLTLQIKTRIINGDSQQIIRELPILCDRPLDFDGIPHELYGYKSINDSNSSYQWMEDAIKIIEMCWQNNEIPIVVGGSGFYLRNLVEGHTCLPKNKPIGANCSLEHMYSQLLAHDPKSTINKNDKYRIARNFSMLDMGSNSTQNVAQLSIDSDFYSILLKSEHVEYKIRKRIDEIFNVASEEVRLQRHDPRFERILGYREVRAYNEGQMSELDAKEAMRIRIRQYAKRQRTWFRRMSFQFIGTAEDFFQNESLILDFVGSN